MYLKSDEQSSDRYYQKKKEILPKRLIRSIKIFLKKEKKKSSNMVLNDMRTI